MPRRGNNYSYKHNRYLGFERVRSEHEYEREKSIPTEKQVKFFKALVMRCKENNLDCSTGKTRTRAEYSMAIDKLILRLTEAGVAVKSSGKEASYVLSHKSDARNNEHYTTERIVVYERDANDGGEHLQES